MIAALLKLIQKIFDDSIAAMLKLIPERLGAGIGIVVAGMMIIILFGQPKIPFYPCWLGFGALVVLVGLCVISNWGWNEFRPPCFEMSTPEQAWDFRVQKGNLDEYNPTCRSVVVVDLMVRDTDVEIMDFQVLRFKDGLCCGINYPEMRVDEGDPVKLNGDYEILWASSVLLKAGIPHKVSYEFEFVAPLANHYSYDHMQEGGEIRIMIKYRFNDTNPTKRTLIKCFRRTHAAPGGPTIIYKSIKRISSPPRLNNQVIRAAWWRGLINGDDRRFVHRFEENNRFVALMNGKPRGLCAHIDQKEIDRLMRIEEAIRRQKSRNSLIAGRAGDKFGTVAGAIVSVLLFLHRMVRRSPLA